MTIDEFYRMGHGYRETLQRFTTEIFVCGSGGCAACGAGTIRKRLESICSARGVSSSIRIVQTGCIGFCSEGPLVRIHPSDEIFTHVSPDDAEHIIERCLTNARKPHDTTHAADIPFFTRQHRIVLRNAGLIDPESVTDYIGHGGYEALAKAISYIPPEGVILELRSSRLRDRGGNGSPVGLTWGIVARAKAERKYVVCNADKGDPGAFVDRGILEGDPHKVLEGMAIAGYAVGAEQGYIYIRGDHRQAIERVRKAIDQAERRQLLGNRIFDSSFNFRIDIRKGAGTSVCGDETALIASIEGARSEPRPSSWLASQCGLWGKPTLVSDVENFANIPSIILHGGKWFASIGTEKCSGTKVFWLAGFTRHGGLIEVPMGIPLRDIVYDIGGGIRKGEFKAVHAGGPFGGCIPAQHLDTPVDFDSFAQLGAAIGSGGLVVLDDSVCMVDLARHYSAYFMNECCGKCTPCRVGTHQLHAILDRMTSGNADTADFATLEELCDMLKDTSLCGLGQSAPNSVLGSLHFFRKEYEDHIHRRLCPAGSCRMQSPMAASPRQVKREPRRKG
ncbi:MAG: NADH-ubiquinone oxidoreductase-F iron-sulfur binding region domain-containing protein [Bacteroidota bacterium]|nr:NADH-ubiquinone oxidoreductase-F iron-sulfur binding region domain-containing protein [Bacteroidota bacterium]